MLGSSLQLNVYPLNFPHGFLGDLSRESDFVTYLSGLPGTLELLPSTLLQSWHHVNKVKLCHQPEKQPREWWSLSVCAVGLGWDDDFLCGPSPARCLPSPLFRYPSLKRDVFLHLELLMRRGLITEPFQVVSVESLV